MSQRPNDRADHKAVSAFIASLSFLGMNDQSERVVDAHAQTYLRIPDSNKISNQSWYRVTFWLGQDDSDPFYRVSGKAASGKSALMRYIIENDWRLCKFKTFGRRAGQKRKLNVDNAPRKDNQISAGTGPEPRLDTPL